MSNYEYDFNKGVEQYKKIMDGGEADWIPVTTQMAEFCMAYGGHNGHEFFSNPELFVRGIGGRYDSIRAGEPTGFNPLGLPDTPTNKAFSTLYKEYLIKQLGNAKNVWFKEHSESEEMSQI